MNRILQPKEWAAPRGYSNGVEARGRLVFVAGQVAFDASGRMIDGDLPAQVERALTNVVSVLACAGAGPQHITRMTWYVTDIDEYRRELARVGEAYRKVMGKQFPAMTLIGTSGLVEPLARVEIEATAVVPDGEDA